MDHLCPRQVKGPKAGYLVTLGDGATHHTACVHWAIVLGHHVKPVGPCCTPANQHGGRQHIKVISESQVSPNILVRPYTLPGSAVEPELCQQTKKDRDAHPHGDHTLSEKGQAHNYNEDWVIYCDEN